MMEAWEHPEAAAVNGVSSGLAPPSETRRGFWSHVVTRVNSRSLSMLLASFLVVSGVVMVMFNFRDEGDIDITSPFLTGHVRSGHVGVLFLVFGVLVVGLCLRAKRGSNIEIKFGGLEFRAKGYISEECMERVAQLIKELGSRESHSETG